MRSNDAALRAYTALYALTSIAEASPNLLKAMSRSEEASMVVYGRGFRYYYMLAETVGGENLQDFREWCNENSLAAGIRNGKPVAVDPEKMRMFEVDMKKFVEGVTDVGELLKKELPTEFPKNLNCSLFI